MTVCEQTMFQIGYNISHYLRDITNARKKEITVKISQMTREAPQSGSSLFEVWRTQYGVTWVKSRDYFFLPKPNSALLLFPLYLGGANNQTALESHAPLQNSIKQRALFEKESEGFENQITDSGARLAA